PLPERIGRPHGNTPTLYPRPLGRPRPQESWGGWPAAKFGSRMKPRLLPHPRRRGRAFSWTAGKLLELWPATLDEGVATFLSLFGHVVEQRGVAGQLLDSSLAIQRGIEGRFKQAQSKRALLENFPTPLKGFFL